MKTLTFQVSDEVYEACQQIATQYGRTEEEVVLEWLAKRAKKKRPKLTEEESRAAWERLLRHAGAVSSGDPRSADNDRIDADLAREYGSSHEEEG
jgi:predicted transcriptional regulator